MNGELLHKFYRLLGRALSIRKTHRWKNLGDVAVFFQLDITVDPEGGKFLFNRKNRVRGNSPFPYCINTLSCNFLKEEFTHYKKKVSLVKIYHDSLIKIIFGKTSPLDPSYKA